jgi:hypothetical protein
MVDECCNNPFAGIGTPRLLKHFHLKRDVLEKPALKFRNYRQAKATRRALKQNS